MSIYTITTPIYYVNDFPHIGTAYATVLTDVLARYHRARGEEVFFLTGTDENGEKIVRAAEEKGLTARQLVDTMSERYRSEWALLNISYDRFIRTIEEDHVRAAQEIFRTLQANGDIYKGHYEGWYCVSDETFVLESSDGTCPECGRSLERLQRDSYFFALSRYTERLLKLYESQPDFVTPDFRRNEVVSFIRQEGGLRDMSISRENSGWGVPVPGDESQVLYVWFDALVNYVTACGYPDNPDRLAKFWPAALHIVGKDILVRFHATLWPAMLISAGLPLPQQILAHGHWTMDGQKMSKSRMAQQIARWRESEAASLRVPGLRPSDLVHSLRQEAGLPEDKSAIAVDALRYFLMRELPAGADAEFNLERLVERYNAELANDLGNLLNRTLSMLHRYREGTAPAVADGPLAEAAKAAIEEARAGYEANQPADALAAAWRLIATANQFITRQQPWTLYRENRQAELDTTLYQLGESCRIAAVLAAPVIPSVAKNLVLQLGLVPDESTLRWEEAQWGLWKAGTQTTSPEPIFPRIEAKKKDPSQSTSAGNALGRAASDAARSGDQSRGQAAHGEPANGAAASNARTESTGAPGAPPDEITMEEFAKVRLQIATILKAERVEGARKLLQLELDLGDEQRQIVSGIAEQYSPESLVGRQIAVIVNLKPATIRGVRSFGMLLAADAEGSAILLHPDRPVPPGSPVR